MNFMEIVCSSHCMEIAGSSRIQDPGKNGAGQGNNGVPTVDVTTNGAALPKS
jgi:hypothetical protein